MNVITNPETGQRELITTGILEEILDKQLNLKTDKATPYKLGLVKITYPDNTSETVTASIWNASIDAHPDKFTEGSKVGLAVTMEGEYAGNAKIQLPGSRVNINKFKGLLDMSDAVPAGKAVAQTT